MTPTWQSKDGTLRLYQADAVTALRAMPAKSVHCCVTSPPYWSLRDYGTAKWEGGDEGCDHIAGMARQDTDRDTPGGRGGSFRGGEIQFRDTCGKCGARRIDAQLGLEPTPEQYVAKMVEVFREVKRVLRDDGTLWLNLGSSYASGGMSPSQSPLLRRVPSCGNDGKALRDFLAVGRVCLGSDGESLGETQNRRPRNAHSDQSGEQGEPPPCTTARGIEPLDCDPATQGDAPLDARESTTPESSPQPSVASGLSATDGEHPSGRQTLPPCVSSSERNSACTFDISRMLPPLVVRTVGKASFFSACQRSDCKGIGRCGLCWCSLAIPSLNVKPKDEINMPHLVAMALQADGWVLRQTIVWAKKNCMPESCRDRCTHSHEYIFLLSKAPMYFYDAEAVKEPSEYPDDNRTGRTRAVGQRRPTGEMNYLRGGYDKQYPTRNRRSVWTVATAPFSEAHFATFPPKLIEPCILAGCPEGGTVLDPFSGAGTTGLVCYQNHRNYLGIELNPEYVKMSARRLQRQIDKMPLFALPQTSLLEEP